jgi:hypothetical protein
MGGAYDIHGARRQNGGMARYPNEPGDEAAWSATTAIGSAVAEHLAANGWQVRRHAEQRGGFVAPPDVEAHRGAKTLLVEVLGYPNREVGDRPSRQWLKAERSVAEVVFSTMLLRASAPECEVAVAFPDLSHYARLIGIVNDVLRPDALSFLVVSADGAVRTWAEFMAHREAADRAEASIRQKEIEADLDAAAEQDALDQPDGSDR